MTGGYYKICEDQPKDQISLILSIIVEETISKEIFIMKKCFFLVMKLLKIRDIWKKKKIESDIYF